MMKSLVNGQCYGNLHYLCKNIGQRISVSQMLKKQLNGVKKLMESYGF